MLFSNKNDIQPSRNATIDINGQPITCLTKTKFLGVVIDNKLTWKEHISYICGKVAKGIVIIWKARKYFNKILNLICITLLYIHILLTAVRCGDFLVNHTWMPWWSYKQELSELFQGFTQEHILIHCSRKLNCSKVHNYDTHQRDHYHVPDFKSRLGKINLRYNGVIVWNNIV